MDDDGLNCFRQHIANSRCYVEYGSGASTLYAIDACRVPRVVTVETSQAWIHSLQSQLRSPGTELAVLFCDVGPVYDYGRPLTGDKITDFWRYMTLPWGHVREHGWVPDLVLIDGRFRVASFLYSLMCARVGTTVLFDDYFNRPHYFITERFCPVAERYGHMAVFHVQHQYDPIALTTVIAEYSVQSE